MNVGRIDPQHLAGRHRAAAAHGEADLARERAPIPDDRVIGVRDGRGGRGRGDLIEARAAAAAARSPNGDGARTGSLQTLGAGRGGRFFNSAVCIFYIENAVRNRRGDAFELEGLTGAANGHGRGISGADVHDRSAARGVERQVVCRSAVDRKRPGVGDGVRAEGLRGAVDDRAVDRVHRGGAGDGAGEADRGYAGKGAGRGDDERGRIDEVGVTGRRDKIDAVYLVGVGVGGGFKSDAREGVGVVGVVAVREGDVDAVHRGGAGGGRGVGDGERVGVPRGRVGISLGELAGAGGHGEVLVRGDRDAAGGGKEAGAGRDGAVVGRVQRQGAVHVPSGGGAAGQVQSA